jgi:hypothetical protein
MRNTIESHEREEEPKHRVQCPRARGSGKKFKDTEEVYVIARFCKTPTNGEKSIQYFQRRIAIVLAQCQPI